MCNAIQKKKNEKKKKRSFFSIPRQQDYETREIVETRKKKKKKEGEIDGLRVDRRVLQRARVDDSIDRQWSGLGLMSRMRASVV